MSAPTERGPSLGTYRGRDIPEYLVYGSTRMSFVGIAVEDNDGAIALAQLASDERVVAPGLIYRVTPTPAAERE